MESSISHLGSLLSLLQLLLCLAERGEIQSSNLLFVSLDLLLQFSSKVRHPLLVLLILILREGKLLHLALSSLVCLHVLRGATLNISKLSLQLPDSHLHLSHCSLATLHSSSLSINQATL